MENNVDFDAYWFVFTNESEFVLLSKMVLNFTFYLLLWYPCDFTDKFYFIDLEYGWYNYRGFDIGNHFNEYAGFDCDFNLCVV